jgi:uncharacterized protein VirK/YbjX
MRPLPYYCICNIPSVEKWRKYVKQAFRECELVEAVMNGYKPKISVEVRTEDGELVSKHDYVAEVEKADDFLFSLTINPIEIERDSQVIAILHDVHGQPLCRRQFIVKGKNTITFEYVIGVERTKWVPPPEVIW